MSEKTAYPWENTELAPRVASLRNFLLEAVNRSDYTLLTNKTLGYLIVATFTEEENRLLEQLGDDFGEDVANQWMVDVLVETGRFVSDGKGNVCPKNSIFSSIAKES
jgi:hypothetical protein